MKRIQSKLHRIGIYDVGKISLFCFDGKRYILDDGINSLAYFHKDISQLNYNKVDNINNINKISKIDTIRQSQ